MVYPLNNVTDTEYAELIASVEAAFEEHFNCYQCKKTYAHMPAHQKNFQAAKGCFSQDKRFILDNLRFTTCPGNKVTPQARIYIDMFMMFQKGVLPYPGGISEQPAKIIDVFNIIDSTRQRKIKEKQEEAELKAKNKSGRRAR